MTKGAGLIFYSTQSARWAAMGDVVLLPLPSHFATPPLCALNYICSEVSLSLLRSSLSGHTQKHLCFMWVLGLVAVRAWLHWEAVNSNDVLKVALGGRKEGKLLIPGSQLGCMDGIASVHVISMTFYQGRQ